MTDPTPEQQLEEEQSVQEAVEDSMDEATDEELAVEVPADPDIEGTAGLPEENV